MITSFAPASVIEIGLPSQVPDVGRRIELACQLIGRAPTAYTSRHSPMELGWTSWMSRLLGVPRTPSRKRLGCTRGGEVQGASRSADVPLTIVEVFMTKMRSVGRTASGTRLDSGERGQSGSVLPWDHNATTPEGLIQQGLLIRLQELERLIGTEALRRTWLTMQELHAIAGRIDAALEGVSGVSPRDRTLAWLHDAIVEVATAIQGDFSSPRARLTLPRYMFWRFNLGMTGHFPRLRGTTMITRPDGGKTDVIDLRLLGSALDAAAMAMRPGGCRGRGVKVPPKWEAFRNLAEGFKLLSAMKPDHLRRVVLDARARLSKVRPPVARA
mgnify:CR=1 FL=1